MDNLPTISIVIPTLNSAKTIGDCLESAIEQDYPQEKIEVVIADGGSTDDTLKIIDDLRLRATELPLTVTDNPLKTGEAGKATALKKANHEIIAFIDSDNILEGEDWLRRMVKPFEDPEIVAAEPLYYAYRRNDGFITRYCALMGMNDPLCYFLGNYDRYSLLGLGWTEVPVLEEDRGSYLKIILMDERRIPTMGANGFLIRRGKLSDCNINSYLFDIDVIYHLLKRGEEKFAKVKIGIIHIFSGSIRTFIRKQKRRIRDYLYFSRKDLREYPWGSINKLRLLRFVIYCLLIFPLLYQAVRGYCRKPDRAWFFHPLACLATFYVYAVETVSGFFRVGALSREQWS